MIRSSRADAFKAQTAATLNQLQRTHCFGIFQLGLDDRTIALRNEYLFVWRQRPVQQFRVYLDQISVAFAAE
jgi:hypothetical protein